MRDLNRTIVKLAKELNKPVCATGDVHFLDPEQEQFRHILLNASGFSDADKSLPIYFKTTDEMLDEFAYLGAEDCRKVVIDNPNHIAKMCDVHPAPAQGVCLRQNWRIRRRNWSGWCTKKPTACTAMSCPRSSKTVSTWSCRASSSGSTMSSICPPRSWWQDSMEHGYLVGSRGSVGSSIVAFLSGITEVNSLPPHYRCPNCRYSDFDHLGHCQKLRLRGGFA